MVTFESIILLFVFYLSYLFLFSFFSSFELMDCLLPHFVFSVGLVDITFYFYFSVVALRFMVLGLPWWSSGQECACQWV